MKKKKENKRLSTIIYGEVLYKEVSWNILFSKKYIENYLFIYM